MPTNAEINYNMVSLLPRLYKENKQDTLNAVINYYLKNLGMGYFLAPYYIIDRIGKRGFTEELPNLGRVDTTVYHKLSDSEFYEENIFKYLEWYMKTYKDVYRGNYSLEASNVYFSYFDFLCELAKEQASKPYLTSTEKFLLAFFEKPSDSLYDQIKGKDFDGTLIKAAFEQFEKDRNSLTGFHAALVTGAWVPTGNLSVLGVHPILGVLGGRRWDKLTIDIEGTIKFANAPKKYIVQVDNTLYPTNYFLGIYMGMDASYQLFRNPKKELSITGGIAYESFEALPGNNNQNNNNNAITKTIISPNGNIGIEYKLFTGKMQTSTELDYYLSLQVRYHLLQFVNNGGTNLNGNAWTLGLIFGYYSHKTHRIYNRPLKYKELKDN